MTPEHADRLLNVIRHRKQTYTLGEMAAGELDALEVLLVSDLASTRRRMDEIQLTQLASGIVDNPGEYRWLNNNRRIMTAQVEAVKRARAAAHKRERARAHLVRERTFPDLFMDVAREQLPFEQWDSIMKEVNRRRSANVTTEHEVIS